MLKKYAAAFLSTLLLSSCAMMQTSSDYDKATDFTAYKTFSWMPEQPRALPGGNAAVVSALNIQRIMRAVERVLKSKGFEYVESNDDVNFVLSFTVGARDRISVTSYPYPYRGPWRRPWPYYGREVNAYSYREGILAIDIFDNATGQPVWHGKASKRISESDISNAEEQINFAVAKILEMFPPPLQ